MECPRCLLDEPKIQLAMRTERNVPHALENATVKNLLGGERKEMCLMLWRMLRLGVY